MNKEREGQERYPFNINYLPECFYKKAMEDLNETPNTRQVELKNLKDLLSADTCTDGIVFEEDFLHLFLRHSKYHSSKAYQYVLKFIKFRRNHSSIFQNIPDGNFDVNPYTKCFNVLPYRSPDGCVMALCELGKWDPKDVPFEDFKRLAFFSHLIPLRHPMTQICGYKTIYDFHDTLKFIRYVTPQNVILLYNAAMNCIPARYKEVHFVNKNVALEILWSLLKCFLSKKIKERFIFHSKPEDLLNHFPSYAIPAKYGGSLKDYQDVETLRRLNREFENYPLGGPRNYL